MKRILPNKCICSYAGYGERSTQIYKWVLNNIESNLENKLVIGGDLNLPLGEKDKALNSRHFSKAQHEVNSWIDS